MTVSHTWTIQSLEAADNAGLSKVVNQINWSLLSDDGNGHTWRQSDSRLLAAPDPETFIAYETLTQEIVLGWLGAEYIAEQELIGANAIQLNLDQAAAGASAGVPWAV